MARQIERSASTRMGEELASILRALRLEARTPQMMSTGLDAVMSSLGAEGVAVIRLASGQGGPQAEVVHRSGLIGGDTATMATLLLRAEIGGPSIGREPDGRPVIAAVCRDGGTEAFGLLAWRRHGARVWTSDDAPLVDAIAGIVCLLRDAAAGVREVIEATRTDPLTALLSRRAFLAEASRHIARLERDELPGTLMLAEVDNLDSVVTLLGARAAEQVLRRAAVLLRSTVRPTDVVGRFAESEFAVWLNGADYLTAAERAESLCLEAPSRIVGPRHAMLPGVSFSIGIATRRVDENFDDLVRRASDAVREVKSAGGGYWRVSLAA